MRRRPAAVAVLLFLLCLPTAARADPSPEGITAAEAAAIAAHDPKVSGEREAHGGLTHSVDKVDGNWEVAYFASHKEVALVVVDPLTGLVRESWTGYQVAWKMARGYSGAFGHKLNAPYVFLPLCAIFLLGLLDWRRPLRAVNLDLLALLFFGVSNFFFNRGEVGISVPLQYVPLAYLFGRALWIGLRGGGGGLAPRWPAAWLLVAALFLIGFRVGLNMTDSGVIDVGYASEVGANRIAHGEPVYDNFPADVSQGDTYGPVNYLAYVPFERIWPWSGEWNDLPAAHGAAVFFDLATFALLILLGRRIRPGPEGNKLAASFAFAWAAYPYTAYALLSNSNDTLVAMLLVATLLALARPAARGVMTALATLAKFAPAVLVPMLATYGERRSRFTVAFAATAGALLLWPAMDPGLPTVYDRTIAYQAGRASPFSIWGQVTWLEPVRIALIVGVALLAIAFAIRPKDKKLTQVAALGAALLIGVQLTMEHWFYLYIVWFYPLLLVAMSRPERGASPTRSSQPAPPR
ncbi:MAG TPA: glycosyltransferase 87 family protein [Solirubrobacterales bacterium]|nr:glycosyltransferase 87 family protein [Solirubrobacterales bacterium]